ncbi:MAG: GNAT family N-acetyltransferase [Clostridia bacterium]|nr:GNAT family N-acetyltransferase [Clostridia bacterium]
MDTLRAACTELYNTAFPGEEAFATALFDRCYPDCLRVICEDGQPVSMLFSIPYPLVAHKGEVEAHYLYAVATHPNHRGKGYAKRLLLQEAARYPVFLRPMSPSLFDFYAKAGFSPISPIMQIKGPATAADEHCHLLSATAYLIARDALAPLPCCRPTPELLSLYADGGGFASCGEDAAVLYEKREDTILFKEYWGNPDLAPRLAAFLGGSRYVLRRCDPKGEPFGMGIGLPADVAFLAALD